MNSKSKTMTASSRARAAAFIGLSIALVSVSAWITVPLGPVPFTLQMFAITLVICILPAPQAIGAIVAYVAIGAIGIPVFSGFRGGIGVILGPTGGFLLGYLIAVPVAVLALSFARSKVKGSAAVLACDIMAGVIFTIVAYVLGCLQFSAVAGVPLQAAFATSVLPFIIPDAIKIVAAAACAQPINRALHAI